METAQKKKKVGRPPKPGGRQEAVAIRIEPKKLKELKELANNHKTSQAVIIEVAIAAFEKLTHDAQEVLIKEQIYKQFFAASRSINEIENFLEEMKKKN